MAIGRPSLFTAISGKMGPVEFAQKGVVTTIRNAKKRKTKVTWRTIEAQRLQANKIAVWRRLKAEYPVHIAGWATYAALHPIKNRFGQPHTLSEFQYFMRLYAPTEAFLNFSWLPPSREPRTAPPTDFWATICIPGDPVTLLVNADFNLPYPESVIKIVYYSDPIPASGNTARVRHHHLGNFFRSRSVAIQDDFTALCAQRNIEFKAGDQIIVTIVGIRSDRLRSVPTSITVEVEAG